MSKPNHESDRGPGDKEAAVGTGGQAGAERPAPPAPLANEPPAVRQPVSFENVDVDEAVEIAATAIRVAAGIVGEIDAYPYVRLASHLVREIASGRASGGVQVRTATESTRTGRGHLPELYTPAWEVAGDLAVRLITIEAGRRVHFEEIYSAPAEISRDHNGLGTHHNPQARRAMHFIGLALGTADRHTTSYATPLLVGTRDDISAATADIARISGFGEDRGRSLPASWSQHVEELLRIRSLAVRALQVARPELSKLLRPIGLTERDIGRGFSRTFVMRALPYGPPQSRKRLSANTLVPADEASVSALFARIARPALIFAGAPRASGGGMPTPEELDRRGFRELVWDVGDLGALLGVARLAPWGVEYRWSRPEQTLVRIQAGKGAWMESWRLFGFRESKLPEALALAERSREEWPIDCLTRAYRACAPGKLKTSDLDSQNAWRGMLRVADAALVAADRRMRQRHARS